MRRLIGFVFILGLGTAPGHLEARGCDGSMPIWNGRYGAPEVGGFDLTGTGYEGKASPGPKIRFWSFGNFEKANSGTQEQANPELLWIANPSVDDKITHLRPGLWSLWQANWGGGSIAGCFRQFPEPYRTVVELSFADPVKEGTKEHAGYFAIASVTPDKVQSSFDFDLVRGGTGPKGNIVPAVPIPAPKVVEVGKAGADFTLLTVQLPEAVSYSEGGKDAPVKLVRGYRIVYSVGEEPTTSDPAKWSPARDPSSTGKEHSFMKAGSGQVVVPSGKKLWLAAQVVYEDASPLLSRATSAHVAVESPAAGSAGAAGKGRSRGGDAEKGR